MATATANVTAFDINKVAAAAVATYRPSVDNKQALEIALHEMGTMLVDTTEKVESSLVSKSSVLVADYMFFQFKETGIFPKEKDVKNYIYNAMGLQSEDSKAKLSGKTSMGVLTNIIGIAIKAGTLVFLEARTTFCIRWAKGAMNSAEPMEDGQRYVMHRKNAVYPNRKEGSGDKAFPVPEGDHYVFASQDSIGLAYSHFVAGNPRDEYGRPKRGQVASHDLKLSEAGPDKVFDRTANIIKALKPNDDNKEKVRALFSQAAEYLGEHADIIEVENKVKLTDDQGNDLPLDVILGIARDELAEKSFIQHDERTQEMAVALFELLKGMIADVHTVKVAA